MGISLLRCKPNLKLCKTFVVNGKGYKVISSYGKAAKFQLEQIKIKTIEDLTYFLIRQLKRKHECLINAIPSNGAFEDGRWAPRNLNETIKEAPVNVIFLDIDDLDIGIRITPRTPLKTIGKMARSQLPPPFNKAECVVEATASYGMKGGVNVRLVYLNHGARLSLKKLREIFHDMDGIDTATLRPNQPIYTAAPIFEDPEDGSRVRDPVPKRIVKLNGAELHLTNKDLPSRSQRKERTRNKGVLDDLVEAVKASGLYIGLAPNGQHDIQCFQSDRHSDPADTTGAWISTKGDTIWCGCQHAGCGAGRENHIEALCALLGISINLMNAERFLERFAVMDDGNRIADLETRTLVAPGAFTLAYRGPYPDAYAGWVESPAKNRLAGTGFEPNGPTILIRQGQQYLNLYREPEQWLQGVGSLDDYKLFEEYTNFLWDENAKVVLDWCAHRVQYPQHRPAFAPFHISNIQGVGRTLWTEILGQVVGRSYAKMTTINALVRGQYNQVLSGSVLVVVNETRDRSVRGGKYVLDHKLRDILTDTRMEINHKYGNMGVEEIYAGLIFNANEYDAIGLPETDRRLFIHRCENEFRNAAYYDKVGGLLGLGPASVIRHQLMERDITDFMDIKRAPMTRYKAEMIDQSGSGVDQFMEEMKKFWPYDVITPHQLMDLASHIDDEFLLDSGIWRSVCQGNFTRGGRNKNRKLYLPERLRVGQKSEVVLPWVIRNDRHWAKQNAKRWVAEIEATDKLIKRMKQRKMVDLDRLFLET